MKKYRWVVVVVLIAIFVAGFFLWRGYKNRKTANQAPSSAVTSTSSPAENPAPPSTTTPAPTLVYPISNFTSRATTNLFGSYYPPGGSINPDRKICPSATYYPGYHTATDLETTAAEAGQSVEVYAIAAGTVRSVGSATGYGGLIIIGYNLAGIDYTAYYGHIDLSTTKVKNGQSVTVGQPLASLGPACSSANGDVRKHLHFGLHKGTSIDERGYVPNQTQLSAWVDPALLLKQLNAG